MSNAPIPATPIKLRDGTWGARVKATVKIGEEIEVRTAAGKTWRARVTRVVWRGADVVLAATESLDPAPRPRRRAGGCHTDGNCSSVCDPKTCPCGDGSWFRCC